MKTTIKSIITRVVALAAIFITGSALAVDAPTPVAVWNGDFNVLSKNGLVLDLNGSAVNDGVITVSSGVKITKASGAFPRGAGTTIIAELSDIPVDGTKAARKTLMTTYLSNNGIISIDSIEEGKAYQDWLHGNNGSAKTSENPLPTGKCVLAMAYEGSGNASTKGATSYLDGALLLNTPGLVSTITDINALWIGSYSDGSCVATGMKISKIAVFDKKLTADQIAAFDFDFPAWMYGNKLATNAESVPAGTYGEIVVPDNGYMATAFTAKTKITGGEGSYDKIQYKVNNNNDTRTHTVSGWFKISAYDRLVYTALAYTGDAHGGYKVYCNSSGNLEIGKCHGSNFGWTGNKVTAQTALLLDTWYYLTFAITKNDANRNAKVAVFVNGSVVYEGDDEFATNLNGNNCIEFDIGADVSAAGLYIDATAVTDTNTIKNWATNERLVEAIPDASTATINGESNWSDLDWSVEPESMDLVKITVAGDSTLTIDKDVSVAVLVFAGSGALTIKGEHALTAESFNIDSFTLASGALSLPADNTLTSVVVEEGAVLTLNVSSAKTLNGISGAGKLVKTGSAQLNINNNASGWSIDGSTIQINQGNVQLNSDDHGSKIIDTTFVMNGGSLNCYGWPNAEGTLTVENDGDATILNKSLSGTVDFFKKGAGTLTLGFSKGNSDGDGFSSVTVEDGALAFSNLNLIKSGATFDFAKHDKTSATIAGAFTFSDTYTFIFPDDWAAGEAFQLCTGAISGVEGDKVDEYTFYCGDVSKVATFNFSSNGAVFYNYGVKQIAPAGDYAISSLAGEEIPPGYSVELTMTAGKTLTIDALATAATKVICDGTLTIASADGSEPTAEELAAIDLSGVTGPFVWKFPRPLTTTADGVTYAGNTGTASAAAPITFAVADGSMTLKDATFYIGTTYSDVQSTVNMVDATVYANDSSAAGIGGLGIGNADFNLSGATKLTTEKVILSQGGGGRTANLTLSDTAEIVVTGSTVEDSNKSSIMFGHYNGPSTFTLNGSAKFTAENAQVLVGKTSGDQTININGGVFTAKGIKAAGGATGTNALNLNGGELKLGEFGISSYGATTIPVTVDGNAKITSTTAMPITQAITVNDGKTLTFDATDGDIVISGAVANNGTIKVVGGNVVFMNDVAGEGAITSEDSGKAIYGYTVNINNCGKFTLPEGKAAADIRLYDGAGNAVQFTDNQDGTVSFDWEITGDACWWDYEFDGDFTSIGTDKTTFTNEGTTPYFNEDNTAVRIGYATAYRSASYPAEFTAVLYGKMVNNNKHVEMGFGSTTGGSKISVAIACGDPAKEEVLLLISNGSSVQKTVTMNVPNAYTANHLYAFVCKTVEARTKIVVYLDGKEWDSYTFDNVVTLGSGFQLGSVHGGCPTGYSKANTSNQNAELDFLRVYNVALNSEAMAMYANEYEYISENGKATREFDGSDGQTWATESSATPWTQATFDGESAAVNCPLPNTLIAVSATAAATVTMNLAEAANYESFEVANGAAITFKAGGTVQPNVTGLTSIGTDVTLDYNAIKIGKVDVASGKTLTFDFANYPFNTCFVDDEIEFTGAVSGEGMITAIGLPTTGMRTVVFELNEFGHYALKITVPDQPFVYEDGEWTWGEQTVEDADLTANPTVTRSIKSDYEVAIGTYDYIVEDGATLKATGLANTGSVTVNAGGVFDVNGKDNTAVKTILNGGTLANTGNGTSYNHIGTYDITFEDDSIVCVSNLLHSLGSGWNAFNYNLNGHKLTKTGAGEYMIATGTYVGGGTIDVQEGTFTIDAGTIPANTTLTLSVADGATVKFTNGQSKGFTKSGTLNLTGAGTVICDGILPTFDSLEGWTGTVWIKNRAITGNDFGNVNNYGNDGSIVKLTGVTGWMNNGTQPGPTVELEDNGNTAALTINDGSSNNAITFTKLSGTGSFITSGSSAQKFYVADATDFTGKITMAADKGVLLGATEGTVANNQIVVADGATIGCTLQAETIVFGRTVTIKGTKGDVIATGLTAAPANIERVKVTMVDESGKATRGRLVYEDGTITLDTGLGFMIMLK